MLTGSFFQLFDYAYYLASLLRTLPRLGGGARVPAEHSSFSKPALQYITMCDQTKTGHSLLSLANHPHHQDQDARNVQTVQQELERRLLTERQHDGTSANVPYKVLRRFFF